MNENINLCKILNDCPKGTKLYSPVIGEVIFEGVDYNSSYPIKVSNSFDDLELTKDGKYLNEPDGECILFPSKTQRNWSEWECPKPKKPKFDPKALQPFDKVVARINKLGFWCCELFSFVEKGTDLIKCCGAYYKYCIPYNDDTKHLVGTSDEAPEYYRYWED